VPVVSLSPSSLLASLSHRLVRGLRPLAMALSLIVTLPALAAAAPVSNGDDPLPARLALESSAAVVLDQDTGRVLYGKNAQSIAPIASITKLMTAMVVLDAELDMDEPITITHADADALRNTRSRLNEGATLRREELLRLALMSSENRAAAALSRAYPGGREAFIRAMNLKAQSLGLTGTRYADATGLSSSNVSTAEDLAALVRAAHTYPRIREFSTATSHEVVVGGRRLAYHNTNALVSNDNWDIGLSKTGFINEAGRCLVMQAVLAGRNVVIVLLDSWGKYARMTDALRIRSWMEGKVAPVIAARKPSTNARTAQARTVNAAPRKPAANKPRRAVRTERGRHTLS